MADEAAPAHDPHFKVKLREFLLPAIYGPPQELQQERLDDIIVKSNTATFADQLCLSFRGRDLVHTLGQNNKLPVLMPRPHSSVVPELVKWVEVQTELEEEMRLARGSLTAVLNAVQDPEDLFKVFPACIHDALKAFLQDTPMKPGIRRLADEQIDYLKAKQGPYLSLLQQRLMRTLINL